MVTQGRTRAAAGLCVRLALALVGTAALAACGPRRAEMPAPSPGTAAVVREAALSIPPGAARYRVDAEHSLVTVRVYRAGRLAMLGHNHVITSGSETGVAWTSGDPAGSGFEVRVAVAGLVVDDPQLRAAAGADFPGSLPESAREGTRRNMLRPEVLDGERHPEIIVRADSLGGTWDSPKAQARVTIKGRTVPLDVPLAVRREDRRIIARGEFSIRQSDFGITPFSIGGGAIAVADTVEISFEIHAVRQ